MVQFNCSGAMAGAKAGLKAEMDAPGRQRGAEGGGKGGGRTERRLAGSSGCGRQHTWSLQAAGDPSVACPPPQGRCPHTELHVTSQPAACSGLMRGQHTSASGCWSAVGVHYLERKRHNPAIFFLRALGSNLMTHRLIASNPPLLLGQAPQWPGCSHFLHTKGKGERSSPCKPDAEQGCAGREKSCPWATCS